jgi:hypothetical protein
MYISQHKQLIIFQYCFSIFHAFARERVKRYFFIASIVACNLLPSSYRLSGPDLTLGIQRWSEPCM